MAGVFSSLASDSQSAPYNTVTSPTEQDATDTGNESGPSGSGSRPTQQPMGKILAAVMRSAAVVQGQEQAKKVAASQADARSKMSVTLMPSDDGGPPKVTVKNAPADLLNGTQEQDLHAAYTTPGQQVEKKLSAAGLSSQPSPSPPAAPAAAPTTQPAADHPLEQAASALEANGYSVIRPWDPTIKESVKSEASLVDIGVSLGIPDARAAAHQAWRQMKAGQVKPEVVVKRLADMAARQIETDSHNLQSTLEPYQQEQQRVQTEQRRAEAEVDRKTTEARLQRSQNDAERRQVIVEKSALRDKTDLSLIDPANLRQTMDSMNTTGVPFTEFEYRNFEQKQKQDVAKAFEDFKGNPEKYALGTYPTWEAAKTAFGHPVTPEQDRQGRAAWTAAHTYALRKANDDTAMQALREARLERLQQQIENATTEKPAAITRSDLQLMSADELVNADPTKIKDYDSALEQKEGLLRKVIAEEKDRQFKAIRAAHAILAKPKWEQKTFGNDEQLVDHQSDAQIATRKLNEAQKELDAITAKHTTRRGGVVAGRPAQNGQPPPDPVNPHLKVVNGKTVYVP